MTKIIRKISIEGNNAYVTLTKGYVAVVDIEDAHLLAGYNWCAKVHKNKAGKVSGVYGQRRCPNGKYIMMHRLIMGLDGGLPLCDHRDGDGLNNRKSNLRLASNAQNTYNSKLPSTNTSGFKGVSWDKSHGKWLARIMKDGKEKKLGRFDDIKLAAEAYVRASKDFHGEFARLE